MKKTALLFAALIISSVINAQTWSLDKAHAKLGFSVVHMMLSDVDGSFKSFDATMTSSKDDFSDAVIELTADASSINTDNEKRDDHLKSADFFDVAKYPGLTFKSKSFVKTGDKKYKMTGSLTMHGVTKTVELDVLLTGIGMQQNSTRKVAGFKITGTLKRSDFGIGGGTPGAVVSDEIKILANVEVKQQSGAIE